LNSTILYKVVVLSDSELCFVYQISYYIYIVDTEEQPFPLYLHEGATETHQSVVHYSHQPLRLGYSRTWPALHARSRSKYLLRRKVAHEVVTSDFYGIHTKQKNQKANNHEQREHDH
jgi:hypothetical protein